MKNKGTILIVEDRFEEKIGSFINYLNVEGFDIQTAETFEDADKLLDKLLKSNKLDGIILDLSFPVSIEDQSDTIDNIPAGVCLYRKYEFKLNNKMIPVVINTTSDNERKEKFFGSVLKPKKGMPKNRIYNVDHESNPLARASGTMIKEIMELFNTRSRERNIKPDKSWNTKGSNFLRDSNGNIIGYR